MLIIFVCLFNMFVVFTHHLCAFYDQLQDLTREVYESVKVIISLVNVVKNNCPIIGPLYLFGTGLSASVYQILSK